MDHPADAAAPPLQRDGLDHGGYTPVRATDAVPALLYFCGIAGAAQALITPDLGALGFPHYRFFQTMLGHGLLVTTGFWVVTVERWRPTLRALCWVTAGLNAYALFVLWVNLRTGSNYLYMTGRPANASLLDFLPDRPWYLMIAEGMAITIFILMYLPFRVSRDRA